MISIIIATKNGASRLERAVKSVLSQSEQDIEIIIVDDASTDETPTIISKLQRHEPRIKSMRNESNIGPGASRDKGIKASFGEYVAFIDDDDEWFSSEKLTIQKDFLDEHSNAVVVGTTSAYFVSTHGKLIRIEHFPKTDSEIRSQILLRNPFLTSSVMLKKSAYLTSGGFSDLYLAEDYDLWMRLGKHGTLANLDGCDIYYTVHTSKTGRSNLPQMSLIVLSLVKKYYDQYPNAIIALLKAYLRVPYLHLKHLL